MTDNNDYDGVYSLAKSLNNRSLSDIWRSWEKDAKEAAERLDTGISLLFQH